MRINRREAIGPLSTLIIFLSSTTRTVTSTAISLTRTPSKPNTPIFPRSLTSISASSPPSPNQLANLNNPILNEDQDVNNLIVFPSVIEIVLETVPDDYKYDEDSDDSSNDDEDNNNQDEGPPSSSSPNTDDNLDNPDLDFPNNPPGPLEMPVPGGTNDGAGSGVITIRVPLDQSPPLSQQQQSNANGQANGQANNEDDDGVVEN